MVHMALWWCPGKYHDPCVLLAIYKLTILLTSRYKTVLVVTKELPFLDSGSGISEMIFVALS
jgi:hypothetical protein